MENNENGSDGRGDTYEKTRMVVRGKQQTGSLLHSIPRQKAEEMSIVKQVCFIKQC